jgi:PAS domain S-box-containing protein
MRRPVPTQRERTFQADEIIVSKTDSRGWMTYVNDVFCRVSLYSEAELLGQPHSLIRHPDMPRAVFHLLWQRIQEGKEIFAYVKNLARNGDYYWVLAHVTPSFDGQGRIDGYHSNRRCPAREAIATVEPLYHKIRAEEERHDDRKAGLQAGIAVLEDALAGLGLDYDRFVLGLAVSHMETAA